MPADDFRALLESVAERLEEARDGLSGHETEHLASRIRRSLRSVEPVARRAFLAARLTDSPLSVRIVSALFNHGIEYGWQLAARPTGYSPGEKDGIVRIPGVGRVTFDACSAILAAHGCSFGMADDPDVVALREWAGGAS